MKKFSPFSIAVTLAVLTLSFFSASTWAGSRMLQARDRWAVSTYLQTAIQRAGYDYAPTVIYEKDLYRMWWCGSPATGNPFVDQIWTAESMNGINWTKFQVALPPAPLEMVSDPSIVHVGDTYYMYFTGTSDRQNGFYNQIYLATSLDGLVWTKYPSDQQPIPVIALPAGYYGYGIGQPSVLYLKKRFWLYYTDTMREGGGTFLASSADGMRFRAENEGHRVLASNSVDVKFSMAMNMYIMVHGSSHDKLFFSSSVDGLQWDLLSPARYLAPSPTKNKSFEGVLAGSATGTISTWTYYYFASQQGTPGLIQDPLSWDIEVGRISFSALPPSGTVFRCTSPYIPSRDHVYDTQVGTPLLYEYELRAFALSLFARSDLVPFFRLYHPSVQDHFYTADPVEKATAMILGYQDEGILGYMARGQLTGTIPLYRLYHSRGDHFYTTDAAEKDQRKIDGFSDEGVAGYVWPADRSGQPAPPQITAVSVFADPQAVIIDYDASVVAGAFDVRLEVSEANQTFRFSNPQSTDPQARFSRILTGNSGSFRLSLYGYPFGRYQVRYAALDESGSPIGRYTDSRTFNVGPIASTDAMPFGFIDLPTENALTEGPLAVEGWALDDQGINRIEVFLDGRSLGVPERGRSRPDVRQVFPSFPNADTSGYRLLTNISALATGPHMIIVEITDTIGQKTLIGPRMIQLVNGGNLAPFGFLDLPQEGSVIGTAVEIGGWALDDRGVARVELLVDGVLVGSAFYGISRPDVAIVFPGYPNDPLAGFVSLMNTSGLSAGTHFLVARIFDVQGLSTDLPARRVVKQ